jgi:translation initiation factor IF-2
MDKEIGKVVHWFDKINVAVVKLSGTLSVGDAIKVKKGEGAYDDTVISMQLDHKEISSGKKGQEVAIKISGVGKDGASICKSA